ncbi:hypothetical protein LJC49_09630 [Ruminococcaceae bacterium OttesenSCG-928-I18]|nr:hypothetical protein [Ruminococcaceae bacterium OttesenSCG-928-I18]
MNADDKKKLENAKQAETKEEINEENLEDVDGGFGGLILPYPEDPRGGADSWPPKPWKNS